MLEYGFILEFFYTCEIIGHTNKSCTMMTPIWESHQYIFFACGATMAVFLGRDQS
jgi:hypothetical protein